jgi:hypothetical protein
MENNLINNEENKAPRTREMQETINHLILGITMWLSASMTCITTLLTVKQPWCLVVLLLPFTFTMFPQIQKLIIAKLESKYKLFVAGKRDTKKEECETCAEVTTEEELSA